MVPADGFPALGWSRATGAYVCCAHSSPLRWKASTLAIFDDIAGRTVFFEVGEFAACEYEKAVTTKTSDSLGGITLAPVLSALAAAEIVESLEMEIIEDAWRPQRFE